MTLLHLSKLFVNLHKLIDAEELDEPPGRLEITMESGRTRILDEADSAIVRDELARLASKRKERGGRLKTNGPSLHGLEDHTETGPDDVDGGTGKAS